MKTNSDPLNALGLACALRALLAHHEAMCGGARGDIARAEASQWGDAREELARHDRACRTCAPCLAPGQASLEL